MSLQPWTWEISGTVKDLTVEPDFECGLRLEARRLGYRAALLLILDVGYTSVLVGVDTLDTSGGGGSG